MSRISQKQMAKLFQRLATSYSAGIDLRTIMKRESETGSSQYRQNMHRVNSSVSKGSTLAEAMQETRFFPDLAISVVHAGERGGRLEQSFKRLAEHYANLTQFRSRLLSALAWPAFELFMAVMIVGLLMVICDSVYATLDMETIDWLWMGSTAGNVIAYFVLVIGILVGIFFFCLGSVRGWFGATPMKVARRIPLIGKTIDQLAVSRFAWTMAVAENAGMNPIEIARLSLTSTENFFYKQHETTVCDLLQKGKRYYTAFKSTGAFPEDLLIYIDNGETAGELAESMDRASLDYQERADLNLKLLGTVGFVAAILIVGAVVLAILVSAVGAYTGILNDLMKP